jgi:hypothetical protein
MSENWQTILALLVRHQLLRLLRQLPAVPTTSCNSAYVVLSTGSISITAQTGVEYSLNGTTYQLSNIFSGLLPGSYSLYVGKVDATCFTSSPST